VTESDLRNYIRKEVTLTEAEGDFSAEDVTQIWDAFVNVFQVAKTAVKSLLSVLVLNVKLVFSTSSEQRQKAREQYQSRRANIENEYEKFVGPAKERFKKLEPLVFLAYPGAYLGYEIAKGGVSNFGDVREFFQQIGVDITSMRLPTGLEGGEGKEGLAGMYGLFGGGTPNTEGALTKIYDQQKRLQASLDRIFGLAQERMGEGVLLEKKGSGDLEGEIENFFKNVIAKAPPESFGLDGKAEKSIVELKSDQAKRYVKDLDAPINFMQKISKAKTVADVKSSLEMLQGTPFVLQGVNQLTPEYLESSAEKALSAAEKKGKLEDLFSEIGVKVPKERSQQLDAVKAYQMRNLLGTTVLKVRTALTKQLQSLKNSYLKEFESDVSLDTLKKIAPGSELEKVMTQGLQNITNAGKLAQPS